MTTLTRAVRFSVLPNGTVRVSLAEPWVGEVRLGVFPLHIRTCHEVTSLLSVTPLEGLKLRAAERADADIGMAVREDIRCVRATLKLAEHADIGHPLLPAALLIWGHDARMEAEQRAGRTQWAQPSPRTAYLQPSRRRPRDRER